MSTLVCLLEEPSAREMLQGVLPRILPIGWDVRYTVFQGKQDMEKNLVIKLRGCLAGHRPPPGIGGQHLPQLQRPAPGLAPHHAMSFRPNLEILP